MYLFTFRILYSDTCLVTYPFHTHVYIYISFGNNELIHCLVVASGSTHCIYLFHSFRAGAFVIILLSYPWWGETILLCCLLYVLLLEGRVLLLYCYS